MGLNPIYIKTLVTMHQRNRTSSNIHKDTHTSRVGCRRTELDKSIIIIIMIRIGRIGSGLEVSWIIKFVQLTLCP